MWPPGGRRSWIVRADGEVRGGVLAGVFATVGAGAGGGDGVTRGLDVSIFSAGLAEVISMRATLSLRTRATPKSVSTLKDPFSMPTIVPLILLPSSNTRSSAARMAAR